MQWKINLTWVICLRIGKTTKTKPHWVNLRLPLSRIHYYQNKQLQVKGIAVPNINIQLNLYPNTQLDLWCSGSLSVQCTNLNTWLTNDAWITVCDKLHSNPLIVVVDLQQLLMEIPIRSLMLVQETLLGYRIQSRTTNAARTLSFVRGG